MPGAFDFPLEQLYTYKGTNPRPDDFDAFWNQSLELLGTFDWNVEMQDAEFQTPSAYCRHLYFTGLGGARIHAKLAIARNRSGKVPGVVQFHGYTTSSGEWNGVHSLASCEFVAAALDCRGQGGLSEDNGTYTGSTQAGHIVRGLQGEPSGLYYRNVFLDTVQLARIIMEMEQVRPDRVASIGGSQGGALALACAALEPRIWRVAANHPFLSDYQRVWEMDLAEGAYAELHQFMRLFDPQAKKSREYFTKLGYIDVHHLSRRITAETLIATGLMDTICPPSTVFAAYNNISSPKKMEVYPNHRHEDLPGQSDRMYQWLMQAIA